MGGAGPWVGQVMGEQVSGWGRPWVGRPWVSRFLGAPGPHMGHVDRGQVLSRAGLQWLSRPDGDGRVRIRSKSAIVCHTTVPQPPHESCHVSRTVRSPGGAPEPGGAAVLGAQPVGDGARRAVRDVRVEAALARGRLCRTRRNGSQNRRGRGAIRWDAAFTPLTCVRTLRMTRAA